MKFNYLGWANISADRVYNPYELHETRRDADCHPTYGDHHVARVRITIEVLKDYGEKRNEKPHATTRRTDGGR